jgi:hypothetical protein
MRIVFLLLFLVSAFISNAQSTKFLDSIKKVVPKDYSNRPIVQSKKDSFIEIDRSKILVALDGKIVKADSPEYLGLKKADIVSVKSITDAQSATGYTQILIITTKRKKP